MNTKTILNLLAMLLLASSWPALAQIQPPAEPTAEQLKQIEQAIGQLRKAAEAAPEDAGRQFQLAAALAAQGSFDEAGPVFAKVVKLDPTNSAARRGEITSLLFLGKYVDARKKLEEGLTALPRDGQLAHTLARLCATAPLEKVRHGELALQLALKVFDIKKTYETGETVAMAYAELGRFEDAVAFQREMIAKAEKLGDAPRAEALRERLLTYLRDEPWRAASPAEIAMATEPPKPVG
ncbi:MAG: hypothetical protein GY719_12150 [bacterium]|nr:hypothetical protein [bacterium]